MEYSPEIFCSIYLDRKGNIVEVRDARNEVRPVKTTEGTDGPARVGGRSPSGKVIKAITNLELVTTENDGDHDDPCWIKDRFNRWRCVCPPEFC